MPPSETHALKTHALKTHALNAGAGTDPGAAGFVAVAELDKLRSRRVMVVKHGKKQIAIFASGPEVYACNNRCPHEGYPLSEGTLGEDARGRGCLLTCNWHNWKFDLESGETLVGGDNLRLYPVRLADGRVWLDLSDPPDEARAEAALVGLRAAFERHDRFREYEHMARELARYMKAGGEPLEAVRQAIHWAHDRLEFGTSHAVATAAAWLDFRHWRAQDDPVASLAILTEVVGHFAWNCLREPSYPYPEGRAPYEPSALVAAIEAEDEAAAVAQIRGALAEGLSFADLEAPLAEAALAHYADFGHSAIFVVKTEQLIERLGPAVAEPLLLALVRSLVYAFREDLIPEFRAYGPALAAWPDGVAPGAALPRAEDFIGLATPAALASACDFAADPRALHGALLGASAWQMLHFDVAAQAKNDRPVQDNVDGSTSPTPLPSATRCASCARAGPISGRADCCRWRVSWAAMSPMWTETSRWRTGGLAPRGRSSSRPRRRACSTTASPSTSSPATCSRPSWRCARRPPNCPRCRACRTHQAREPTSWPRSTAC